MPASQLKEPNNEPGVALLHAVLQELLLTDASQRLMRTSRVFFAVETRAKHDGGGETYRSECEQCDQRCKAGLS